MFREFAAWLQTTPVSVTLQSIASIVPIVQSIHIVTIGIVFVSLLIVVLRILGVAATEQPFGAVLIRFSPWIWVGLGVMTITGATLVVAEPVREFTATSFWLKMGLLVICVASVAAFRFSLGSSQAMREREPVFTARLKSVAVAALLLWIAIIFLGRGIAYDAELWESLSLTRA